MEVDSLPTFDFIIDATAAPADQDDAVAEFLLAYVRQEADEVPVPAPSRKHLA